MAVEWIEHRLPSGSGYEADWRVEIVGKFITLMKFWTPGQYFLDAESFGIRRRLEGFIDSEEKARQVAIEVIVGRLQEAIPELEELRNSAPATPGEG